MRIRIIIAYIKISLMIEINIFIMNFPSLDGRG